MAWTDVNQVTVAVMANVLTDTMDMAQNEAGEAKPFDIAAIYGVRGGVFEHLDSFLPEHELTLRWDDETAILSAPLWDGAEWQLRAAIMQMALTTFGCITGAPESRYRWLFSGKDVRRVDADDVLARWIKDGVPPVMDIIDFIVEDDADGRSIRTSGLYPLVGHEIAARPGHTAHPELARMVGRLAQAALSEGAIRTDSAEGPDGMLYRLALIPPSQTRAPYIEITDW